MLNCDNADHMDDIQIYVPLDAALEANETAIADGKTVNKNVITLEVLKTGTWKTNKGNFSLTASDLNQMADNFNNDVRPHSSTAGLPVDEEHDKKAALAWLKRPRVEANDKGGHTLFMDAELTGTGSQKVKDGTYKFFSPEVHFQHDDPEGVLPKLRNVLMGGGFTNRPLFKGLAGVPALTASDGTADQDNKIYVNDKETTEVDLATIRAKKNADVTEEERKVLDAAKDQLNDTERAEFYPAEAEEARKAAEQAEADRKAAEAAAASHATAGVTANEDGTVTLDASELATLQANAAAGLEASEKLKRNEAETTVTEMFFSEEGGLKLPSDMKTKVTDLWLDASEDQREILRDIAKNSKPLLEANDTREMGTNKGGGQGNAQSLLEDKVVELQANDAYKNLGYSEVLKLARSQNPDLAKEADLEESHGMPKVG